MAQIGIGVCVFIILGIITFLLYKHRANEESEYVDYGKVTIESLLKLVKDEMAELLRENDSVISTDAGYEAYYRNKRRIELANTNSVYGIPADRQVVIALIHDIIERECPTREKCLEVIDFDNAVTLESQVKWEILLLRLSKREGKKVIGYLDDVYNISAQHPVQVDGVDTVIREFDYSMLDVIYASEITSVPGEDGVLGRISYAEMLDVMSTIIFSKYHGFDVIDSLMQLDFDGLNFGTSGSIRYEIDGKLDVPYRTTNSVWVQIEAKWTLFSFLDFYSVNRMKRVINQLVSYGAAPPMTEKSPYKVCDGYDGSRRVAIRPPSGESWAFFVRKFTLSVYKMERLLNKPYVKNWELPATLIRFLMRAEQTTAFTGQQNTGKTTLMKSAMEYVDDKNIRVLEMAFELALREIYTTKNVMTVKPTDYVSSSQLQDLLKKTDGWVSLVGEVAEDIVAARMIQFCLIASAFTVFSHHAKTDFDLVNGLANSLVACGEYENHDVAMSTVLDAIKHNVHLMITERGERCVEYISQIVKQDELQAYPDVKDLLADAKKALDNNDVDAVAQAMVAYTMLARENFTRTTDRVRFKSRKIIVLNRKTMTYEPNEWYTPQAMEDIMSKLNETDREEFVQFYRENWR